MCIVYDYILIFIRIFCPKEEHLQVFILHENSKEFLETRGEEEEGCILGIQGYSVQDYRKFDIPT